MQDVVVAMWERAIGRPPGAPLGDAMWVNVVPCANDAGYHGSSQKK
jgi:hypothetical protein